MLQRVKEVQESDLRMDGALAHNIQRVLPVTQANIDAAAAQGKSWLVKRVVKVNDPLDNMRGGTQLVIKQNSIQPGQNVMRVLYTGSGKTVGPAVAPLSLPGAAADDILSLIAFGGTEQSGVPIGYTALNGITNGANTAVATGIQPIVDDVEWEIRVKPTTDSWYILQARSGSQSIWGIFGSQTGATILLGWNGNQSLLRSDIVRNTTHTYYVKGTVKNGVATLYVKDETDNTEDTKTTTYTFDATQLPSSQFYLFANGNPQYVAAGNKVFMARIKVGGVTVMDYVPALNPSNVVGFYDNATGDFKVSSAGTLTADQTIVPTPNAPMDIVCNNGALAFRDTELPLGYRRLKDIVFDGEVYYVTDVYLTGADTTSFVMNVAEPGRNALGCYTGNSSGNNISFYISTGNSGNYVRYKDGLYRPVIATAKLNTDLSLSIGPTGTTGFDTDAAWAELEFTCPNELYIGWLANATSSKFVGSFNGNITISDRATLVPCERVSDGAIGYYNINDNVFFENQGTGTPTTSGYDYSHYDIMADGPIETIAIKDDQSATVSTATCEDLLSVDTYTDQQEVISGVVTRKVGIKVLDGTENWQNISGYYNISKTALGTDSAVLPAASVDIICTHYETISGVPDRTSVNVGGSYVNFRDDNISTLAGWKQWLANQYAAGTPVIIVFPLATPTTNTVTPQPMQTAAGDNTAEITQAGMAGLELEVEYVEA